MVNSVGHGSTTTLLGNGQQNRLTPCLSTSQDNCSGVGVVIDSQYTTETSARVAETQQWECNQARHRGVNPTSSMSHSQDNDNGVGVIVDALCSTGTNVKVLCTTDQHLHPSDNEPLDMSNRQDKEQVTVRSTQLGPTVGHTLLIPATIHGKDTLMVVDTAAQMSMVSQSFIDSLEHAYTATPEFITIKNAEHGSYMQCYLIKELTITIQHNQYNIDVAVGPITYDFILGLDFLLKHHCIVDIDDSTVTMDGTPVHALMKKGPSVKYNVSRIQVAKRIVIPPKHIRNVMVECTNPSCNVYVTSPEMTDELIIPSCIINGEIWPIVMEIINDSDKLVTLQRGKVLVQAVELDATLDNISKPCGESIQISRTETTDNIVEDNAPSWEEINKINETPPPIATTLIPDDSLNDTQVSTILADVETQIPTHLEGMFTRSKRNISIREQVALGGLLVKYGSVFSKNNNDLGKFTLIRHRINTYNEDPVKERLRRTSSIKIPE